MTPVRDAMIVAGGAGTRLWPLTANRPKPLVRFGARPFLEGVLAQLAAVGVDRVLLVVGADPSPFEVLRPVAEQLRLTVEAVPEPTPLDTAGGVRSALERVRGTFLVLNGDILTDVDLAGAIAAHHDTAAAASIVLTRVEDTSSFGVCVLDGTRITGFVEKPPPGTLPDQDTVNAGTYVLEPEALEGFATGRLSFERQVFPELVASGARVTGIVSDAAWADLGTPQRYLDGHRAVLDGEVGWPPLTSLVPDGAGNRIAPGVHLAARASLVAPVLLAPGARVEPEARVGPYAVVGPDTIIRVGASVAHSVLGADNVIGAGARLHDVITGDGAHLGDGVESVDGAVIADGATVARGTRLPADARVAVDGDTPPG
jgi:mannose-1-phosphate guanylyltransferase